VRELENCIERCVVLSKGPFVDTDVLPNSVLSGEGRTEAVVIPVGTPLRQAERMLLDATLRSTDGDKESAARILGITSRTIYRKLK
jgi:DNA-binding NtrC family response regulator